MNFEKAKAKAEIVANEVGKIIMKIKENNDYWYFHVGFPHTQFFDDDAGSIFVNKKDGTIIESHLWLKEVQKLNWEFYLNSKTIYNYYEEYLKLLIERARKHYRCPSCNNEVSTVQLGEYGGNFVNIVKQEKLKMSYFDDILVDDDFNRDSCFICHKCNKEFDENMDEYINDCLIVETGNIKKDCGNYIVIQNKYKGYKLKGAKICKKCKHCNQSENLYVERKINMTKKEFKKKCKEEKTTSYKLMLFGGIISIISLIIILVTFFIIEEFKLQIAGFVIGGIIAFIGMILDLLGEIILAKRYKKYNK